MPLFDFKELMDNAETKKYALGYFECWNLESLLAVFDAAEKLKSPIIMGYSGEYLTNKERATKENTSIYASLVNEACKQISVPACSIYNESPNFQEALAAIDLGYKLIMFTNNKLSRKELTDKITKLTEKAHNNGTCVEGELITLSGRLNKIIELPNDLNLTSADEACNFIKKTGIDAFAVNIGQTHTHGKYTIHLNIKRLLEIKEKVKIPLVLHGGSYLDPDEVKKAIKVGIRKINIGSILKRTFLDSIKKDLEIVDNNYNPYDLVGSGSEKDFLTRARLAVQIVVENLIRLYGSDNKA